MKKEKTKLRGIQILCIVSLLITVFSIQRTYARYFEKVNTTYDTNIKRWVINVNAVDIHGKGEELSTIMQPVFVENEHMNSNDTLVPGREGYFEFLIDYSKVDLAFRFNFDIKQLNKKTVVDEDTGAESEVDAHLPDFEAYGFEIIDGENTETILVENLTEINPVIDPVSKSISYTKLGEDKVLNLDTDSKVEVRVLFRWNDGTGSTMSNAEDTAFAGEENAEDFMRDLLNYKVKITFTQQV